MTPRLALRIAIAAVVLAVLVPVAWVVLPQVTGPLVPADATRLRIATEPPNVNLACNAALLAPVRIATAGDALVLVAVETGETVQVVWPAGFGAWRVDARAVVADSRGTIIGREGDVLDSLGGGLGADDVFHICPFGIVPADD